MGFLVLVDGEHYPPVVEAALRSIASNGRDIDAAVLVGGREKLPAGGVDSYGEFTVRTAPDPRDALWAAIEEFHPEGVIDLSDEPVLDYRRRFQVASVALSAGVPFEGADFTFSPPPMPLLARKPSLAVIGTGKRTGKTAVAGFVARALTKSGRHPVVVAMGRGGPPEPEVLRGDQIELTSKELLALADSGKHAASDYVEDALLGRVATVGCFRCGGGLAGAVEISNVVRGIEIANELDGDFLVFEGSGSSLPPARSNAALLVIPASVPPEYVEGYFGPYRLLLADSVVVTMCEEPFGSQERISSLESSIHDAWRPAGRHGDREEIRVVRTVFRPTPTRSVEGATVFVTTTAPEAARDSIIRHLEGEHGCRVAGISHSLSDRAKLERDLENVADKAEVVLCEIKAAAIDVATRRALDAGLDVVYMDNVPMGVDGDGEVNDTELMDVVTRTAQLAEDRYSGDGRKTGP
jgi:cyclic 2,3-diphosphoglycerate synthetase